MFSLLLLYPVAAIWPLISLCDILVKQMERKAGKEISKGFYFKTERMRPRTVNCSEDARIGNGRPMVPVPYLIIIKAIKMFNRH